MFQGYNGWRNGLYGYSWDMMVYNVDVAKVQVKVMDHARREQFFLDPNVIYSHKHRCINSSIVEM